MRRSWGLSAALVLTATAGWGVTAAPPAMAVTPPVAFTADDLPTWQTNGIVWALAEAHGTVFVGGTFSQVRPPDGVDGTAQDAVNFVAMNAATGEPTSCKLSFTISSGTATVRALAVSPDGKTLYAGGYFGAVNGVQASSLAAIDIAACAPEPDFRPSFPATVRTLAVTGDTVYAGGDFGTVAGETRKRFAAVDSTTGALRPFRADADLPGRALAVTPDGHDVVLGGDFFTVNGADSHALAVVDATTGATVKTYPDFIETNSVVKSIGTDATGFYTGNEGTGGGVFDGRIALNLSDFGQRWRDTCLGATQAVLSYQNVLYSASHAHDCSSVGEFPDGPRHHLLAQPTTSVGKLGWFPNTNDGLGEGIGPRALAVSETDSNKYLWVGGEFTTVNAAPAQGLTRFAASPDTGVPGVPQASASSIRPGEVQVRWRSSTDTDDSRLTYKIYRNGSSTPVHTMDGDSLPWSRPQMSFTDTTVSPGQTYSYRVTATDAAGNASGLSPTATVTVPTSAEAYPAAVLDDGATQYWRYDESSGPFTGDSSPSDNSGVQLDAPSLRQTPAAVNGPGTAIGFDGTDQLVYSDRPTTVEGAFSIETWFRTTTDRGGKLVGFGNNTTKTSSNYDKNVYLTNAGKLVFGVYTGGAKTVSTPGSYNNGAWHQVVATQGPSGLALYVDGSLKASSGVTGNQQYAGYWRVGGDQLSGWPDQPTSNFFAGQIDETAIYPSALTAQQVTHHHQLASAPADTVATLPAADDTYANAGAPSTNYGTSSSLAVRGTSAYLSYLRFALPPAPAGTVLKSARLSVKTSTQAGAGSTDSQSVVPVTGAWTETGLTYNNRPALGAGTLGTLTGATEGSALYSAALDTAALSPALGGPYSLALTSTGTDPLWLWSHEAAANEGTPQLVLTFGAPDARR
ncbi:DNRLRE domain-containing protein [Streptomyces sp. NBC_01500]|uniref:CBM96 family carbohydrate-binding protein n=1 Tax=Streptomyces sp. NBC_01500 TaxID=2903886 RepID=UPI00224E537A|nr:DNRLRE domain-containing protein [Streptomyces sp. NBC_01500]MCX4553696.1 DNRLRE domain-containing protein [Streptomyces sp. NBC_01500]